MVVPSLLVDVYYELMFTVGETTPADNVEVADG
jgi:hypothetical protein